MNSKLTTLLVVCMAFSYAVAETSQQQARNIANTVLIGHPIAQYSGNAFQEMHMIASKTANHLHFQHLYFDVPVLHSTIVFHIYSGKLAPQIDDGLLNPIIGLEPWQESKSNIFVVKDGDKFVYARRFKFPGPYTDQDSIGYSDVLSGKLLYRESCRIYLHGPDTTVRIPHFRPNPIVSARTFYGGAFVDNLDRSNQALDNEIAYRAMAVRKVGDKITPGNALIRYGEVTAPYDKSHLIAINDYPDSRSHPAFESMNSFAHLELFSDQISKMGYNVLLDTLLVDPHALNGADQSAFNGTVKPPTLEFGQGGVDDAEDGQVVAHEFVHALTHRASPKTYRGDERQQLEEGFADYLAMSYSFNLSGFRTAEVFSWDGHNEFWDAFVTNRDLRYGDVPASRLREVWSSALQCVANEIGQKPVDELVLEQMFYLKPNSTLAEMGSLLLRLDTLMFSANHYDNIKHCMAEKNILKLDHRDIEWDNSGLQIRIINSVEGSTSSQPIIIALNMPAQLSCSIQDMSGKKVYFNAINTHHLVIPEGLFAHGVYILIIDYGLDANRTPAKVIRRVIY